MSNPRQSAKSAVGKTKPIRGTAIPSTLLSAGLLWLNSVICIYSSFKKNVEYFRKNAEIARYFMRKR